MSAAIELRAVEKSFGNTAVIRNVNLVLTSSTQGTYTSDSLGRGTFTLDSPLADGCGPY